MYRGRTLQAERSMAIRELVNVSLGKEGEVDTKQLAVMPFAFAARLWQLGGMAEVLESIDTIEEPPEFDAPLTAVTERDEEFEPLQAEARLVVRFPPSAQMTDDQFLEFCGINSDLRMEREANGDIIIMTPEGLYSGPAHMSLARQFDEWAEHDATGEVLGAASGFKLPNTAIRAADLSWILKSRLRRLTEKELRGFGMICPDFVLELRSQSDSLPVLKRKMEEYLANGARLGWLLDPFHRKVYIYRPGVPVEELQDPATVSGEDVLPGFTLKVAPVWRKLGEDR
jgi:Uma2 family endonuclease